MMLIFKPSKIGHNFTRILLFMIAETITLFSNVSFARNTTRNLTSKLKSTKEAKMLFVQNATNKIQSQTIRGSGQKN